MSAANIALIQIVPTAFTLTDRRKRFAAGLCMGFLAGLVKRRASFGRIQSRIDCLDPVHNQPRLLVVNQHGIDPLDAAIGHQKALRAAVESSSSLDRIVKFSGVFGIELRIGFDGARMHREIGVEHIELEIGAAALRKRKPIWLAVECAGQRHDSIAFVDRSRRRRPFNLLRRTFPPVARLRVRAERSQHRNREEREFRGCRSFHLRMFQRDNLNLIQLASEPLNPRPQFDLPGPGAARLSQ
jgi:hypothetical protein